jgi:hypothetical protein
MFCKVTKEEAIVLNALSDQAYNTIGPCGQAAIAILALSGQSGCLTTSALIQASLNRLMELLLLHRKAHGQLKEIENLGALRRNPLAFQELVGDLNEILAAVMRGIEPTHDYMFNCFKMEKTSGKEGA